MADFFEDLKRDLEAATPGHWKEEPSYEAILDSRGYEVANTSGCVHDLQEIMANARLIARAPQLAKLVLLLPELLKTLTACERVHAVDLRAYDEAWEKTRAVLDAIDNLLAETDK